MKQHTQTLHRRLGELHGLRQQTQAVEKQTLQAATNRLDVVNTNIGKLRDRVPVDAQAAERYEQSIIERGRLHQVIANSRRHLS